MTTNLIRVTIVMDVSRVDILSSLATHTLYCSVNPESSNIWNDCQPREYLKQQRDALSNKWRMCHSKSPSNIRPQLSSQNFDKESRARKDLARRLEST